MGFVHLHCHSAFSFLDGCAQPEELAAAAAGHGQEALALTDWAGLHAAPAFARACRAAGVRPLHGAEVAVPGLGHLTLLVRDKEGWRSLCRLLTAAQLAGRKGQAPVAWEVLARHRAGLLCLSGCRHGALAAPLLAGDEDGASANARRLLALFGADLVVEIPRNRVAGEGPLGRRLAALADALGVPYVATANVHYVAEADGAVAEVLAAIRAGTTLDPERQRRPNHHFALAAEAEMAARCADLPAAVGNTALVAARCDFTLAFERHVFPAVEVPPGETADGRLRALCRAGLTARYADGDPELWRRAVARLDAELTTIAGLGYAPYFLFVREVVAHARSRGIRCQGRGSAAGSLVAYCLGISRVEPIANRLLFARFLSAERASPPDIDVDFMHRGRDDVLAWIYARWGAGDRVAMACTYQCYHERGAARDIGKALGIPHPALAALGRRLRRGQDASLAAAVEAVAGAGAAQRAPWATLLALVPRLVGLPRHLGLHNGGVVASGVPLSDLVPLERAAKAGIVVTQWDKEGLEEAGLVKLDVLGLQALDLVDAACRLVGDGRGGPLDLDGLPLDDPAVYELLRRADTVGATQVESRAQMALLPLMQPTAFRDIVAAISLIRPGPVQAGVVRPYLRRRGGREPATYPHPSLEPILSDSYGVLLWQEQVLEVAQALAGFTGGEGDELRRAMGSARSRQRMAALEARFLSGAAANGVDAATAAGVFAQIAAFAGYGFCRAHAAAFARLAYECLWLRAHHPTAYTCARLNAQPGGFYPPAIVVGDARRRGVAILGPDLARSAYDCTLEGGAVRLGLRYVRGVAETTGARLVAERDRRGPFRDLADLCRRAHRFLPPDAATALIAAGACDGWGGRRRDLVWALPAAWRAATGLPLPAAPVALPLATPAERLAGELWATGIPLSGHPLALERPALAARGVTPLAALASAPPGREVAAAGLLVILQRPPTAHGVAFATLEDETQIGNL
ncbi:MAG TPA: DNA polymerase III subunit alpha, partial [Thermomicrobiales bacterium]|nr:DNA polymerase III subunit alpha [Thermomicrobiales bacterium]